MFIVSSASLSCLQTPMLSVYLLVSFYLLVSASPLLSTELTQLLTC